MLLPSQCPVCRSVGTAPCRRCVAQLLAAPEWEPTPELAVAVALFAYEGVGATLIQRLKYANHRDALDGFARAVVAVLQRVVAARGAIDMATWVPTSATRRRERGFDQSQLVARAVARHLGVPCRSLLDHDGGGPQQDRDRVQRQTITFEPRRVITGRVLVVDDVRTTGASLRAAAIALRVAGARDVVAATLAARP